MGPGPLKLLEKIDSLKSINRAAKDMSLSYVKALNMLNRLERNLDRKLLIRKRGGNDRGGTELTEYAREFNEAYRRFDRKLRKRADKEFEIFVREFNGGWK